MMADGHIHTFPISHYDRHIQRLRANAELCRTCVPQQTSRPISNLYTQKPHAWALKYPSLPIRYFMSAGVVAWTTLVPSTNLVRKSRLAFSNMPSFRLTTMNCDPLNLNLISRPIFCVCDGSSAASTSSRMYIGAGLNCNSAIMSDNAIRELFFS